MLSSMENLIREHRMIPPGSTVLCAVSGGADSVCLLHALYQLRDRLGFQLAAAHFDHQLRGDESRRDAAFVRQFTDLCCGAHRLPDGRLLPKVELYVGRGDVAGYAKDHGLCVEEAGREMRYAFFRQVAAQIGADKIATAHNANDNAETLLLCLARGTGLRGLGGIPPVREQIIRPLLTTSRQEVLDYLDHHSLPHMEDSTNDSDEYVRNRLRHQVLPVLERLSPGFLSRCSAAARRLRADEACLTHLARPLVQGARLEGGVLRTAAAPIAAAADPIALRALRLLLGTAWGDDQDCSAAHLEALLRLCRSEDPSGQIHLPHDTAARREYGLLVLSPREQAPPPEEAPLALPGDTRWGRWQLRCREAVYQGQPCSPWELWLDRAALPALSLRTRRTGDRLALPGRAGSKSVKKWMIQEKLPRLQREGLPILHCEGTVAAVAGLGPEAALLPRAGQPAWHITISPYEFDSERNVTL